MINVGLPLNLTTEDTALILRVLLNATTRDKTVTIGIGPVQEQDLPGVQEEQGMLTLTATQQCRLSVNITDKKGNPAQIDGRPVWGSSDGAVLTITDDADGMGATIIAGSTGTAQVNVAADADLGEGVVAIVGLLDVTVVAGQAAMLALATGTPEEQP